jgi:hypothetical protein
MAFPFGLSVFGDLSGASLTYEETTLPDLGRQINDTIVARKEDQPLAKLRCSAVAHGDGYFRQDINVLH